MLARVKEYLLDFSELFFPNICLSCQRKLLKGEEVICLFCLSELPVTGYWNEPDNPVANRLWGRVPIQGAAAFLQFKKGGKVQRLIHELKYKGRKDVGVYLGKIFSHHLIQSDSVIKDIDLIVPVPLYWKKLKQRGYNQSTPFAQALSQSLDVPYSDTALMRTSQNVSQTKEKRYDRYGNVAGIFSVTDASQLSGKHILLVDDVFTTGATADACLQAILSVPETKVSFIAISVSM
ncbi:MAG: ComF family protein [Bacteroidetes bacterium]|nr:ComF family protein [Bacteroidota bacterium]